MDVKCDKCGGFYPAGEPVCPHCDSKKGATDSVRQSALTDVKKAMDSEGGSIAAGGSHMHCSGRPNNYVPPADKVVLLLVFIASICGPLLANLNNQNTKPLQTLGAIAVSAIILFGVYFTIYWIQLLGKKFIENQSADVASMEEDAFLLATKEAYDSGRREGLWGKCLVQSGGDDGKAKALYIKARVREIQVGMEGNAPDSNLFQSWVRLIFSIFILFWLLGAIEIRNPTKPVYGYFPNVLGITLFTIFVAWLFAALPWAFYRLTKDPLTPRGYMLWFVAGVFLSVVLRLTGYDGDLRKMFGFG